MADGRNNADTTRLTSLLPTTGGGLQTKKNTSNDARNNSSSGGGGGARTSLLGLDRLAAQKRHEQQPKTSGTEGESSSSRRQYRQQPSQIGTADQRSEQRGSHSTSNNHNNRRRFDTETPSHPGGVNRVAQQRAQVREKHYKDRHHQSRGQRQYHPYNSGSSNNDNNNTSGGGDRGGDRGGGGKRDRENNDDSYDNSTRAARQYSDVRGGDDRRRQDYSNHDGDRGRQEDRTRNDNSSYQRPRNDDSSLRGRGGGGGGGDRNSNSQQRIRPRPGSSMMPPPASMAITPSTTTTNSGGVHAPTPLSMAYSSKTTTTSGREDRTPAPQGGRGGGRGSGWDIETPLQGPRGGGAEDPEEDMIAPLDSTITNADDTDFDRQFYLDQEEGGYVLDKGDDQGGGDMGRFLFENDKTKAREQEMEKKRQQQQNGGVKPQPKYNPRHSALQDDQDAWEENRLLSSGAATRAHVDLDHSTAEQDTRVTLLVHQVKPPFLDGRVSFSTVREAVPTVKDNSSDFAKMSRSGSATLRHLRATKEKNAMRQKFWELGGTRMGNVVGVKEEESGGPGGDKNGNDENGQPAEMTGNGEVDYKKSAGFAQHLKKKNKDDPDVNGPVSHFAKTKTIRQQREYLPVFDVRDGLLNVIRENTAVIIVGETGSGKVSKNTSCPQRHCCLEDMI
jgi:pre-mRNA-splicing factor ATP-dependent RNA helicase DHX38/PRP16